MSHQHQQNAVTTELKFCIFLIEQLKTQFLKCDKCGRTSKNLERANPHSDFLYCGSCLQQEEILKK